MSFIGGVHNQAVTSSKELFEFITSLGGATSSGESVNSQNALQISTVYACVRVLTKSIAQIPLILYKRTDEGKIRDVRSNLFKVLRYQPNAFQSAFRFWEMMVAHILLRGNAFAYKSKNSIGQIVELIPIHPDSVTIRQLDNLDVVYDIKLKNDQRTLGKDEIFHLMGLSLNGYEGLNPIQWNRESLGLAKATEKYGGMLFKNGAKMRGILTYPNHFQDEGTGKKVAASFDQQSNGDNAYKTILLEDGMKWEKVSMTNEDSQFLQTRKYQRSEIAGLFGVPLHKIGDLEKSSFNNIEHQSLEFIQDSVSPITTSVEQDIYCQLLTPAQQKDHFAEFLIDNLLKADIKSRNEALQIQRRNGIINADEWREKINMNMRGDEGGKEYIIEANMTGSNDETAKEQETN